MPIVPATILPSTEDIIDRVKRANVKAIFADMHAFEKIESIRCKLEALGVNDFVSIGEDRKGWLYFEDLLSEGRVGYNKIVTKADDIALIYFTSGTTAKPKMVFHTHASYPAGHLTTIYWIGDKPGDRHYNISSPGWAKWAWSTFLFSIQRGSDKHGIRL